MNSNKGHKLCPLFESTQRKLHLLNYQITHNVRSDIFYGPRILFLSVYDSLSVSTYTVLQSADWITVTLGEKIEAALETFDLEVKTESQKKPSKILRVVRLWWFRC